MIGAMSRPEPTERSMGKHGRLDDRRPVRLPVGRKGYF